jgi:hypothetical protein
MRNMLGEEYRDCVRSISSRAVSPKLFGAIIDPFNWILFMYQPVESVMKPSVWTPIPRPISASG